MTGVAERFRSTLEVLRERKPFRFPEEDIPEDFGRAAVLIAFWPDGDDVRCVLTPAATSRGRRRCTSRIFLPAMPSSQERSRPLSLW